MKHEKGVSEFYFYRGLGNLSFNGITVPIPAVKMLHEMTSAPINLPIEDLLNLSEHKLARRYS